jgi:ATP-dependent Clp protease adaptor protein ClpS
MLDMHSQYEELEEILVDNNQDSGIFGQLLVFNDDVNTFDWVIMSFVEILKHSTEQAEQLALLVHFKGKATVKSGPLQQLRRFKEALVDRGLSAVIEAVEVD